MPTALPHDNIKRDGRLALEALLPGSIPLRPHSARGAGGCGPGMQPHTRTFGTRAGPRPRASSGLKAGAKFPPRQLIPPQVTPRWDRHRGGTAATHLVRPLLRGRARCRRRRGLCLNPLQRNRPLRPRIADGLRRAVPSDAPEQQRPRASP